MAAVLVDSNVLLDILNEDPVWSAWSMDALERCAEDRELVINPIIYEEVSIGSERIAVCVLARRTGGPDPGAPGACRLASPGVAA